MRAGLRLAVGVMGITAFSFSVAGGQSVHAASSQLPYDVPAGPVDPYPEFNNMDCNGWSTTYQPVKANMKALCTDPVNWDPVTGKRTKFYDNGHYVGHDEPSVKFISNAPNSANTFTFYQQLATDPAGIPTTSPTANPSRSVYAELSVAPWFGLPICDPLSFPGAVNGTAVQPAPCTPDSDSNNPNSAGSAFMELQFYPPGFGPFQDSTSCDQTRWCAALTIDSLEAICNPPGFTGCATNPQCTEPVNFAYLTRDGVPTGPPSPQLTDNDTFNPNTDTLFMSPGDTLKVSIFEITGQAPDGGGLDTNGLETRIDDLTTGQTGFTIASAHNGFMNTNPATCQGNNFSFHAEYNTAKQSNQVPWAALEGGVLMQDEIGHGEVCAALANQDPVSKLPNVTPSNPQPQAFSDPNVFDNCNDGASDPQPAGGSGNGECQSGTNAACTAGTTEDPIGTNTFGGAACPAGGGLCETADGFCMPAGARTVTFTSGSGPVTQVWNDAIPYCNQARFQNGDLDYDGTNYQRDWPDGGATHPTTFRYIGPFDSGGSSYPTIQFQTDAAGSEADCDTTSGTGCTVPPYGAPFYPFWSVANRGLDGVTVGGSPNYCVWNFGNDGNPNELDNFNGDFPNPTTGSPSFGQYGSSNTSRYGGTIITGPQSNAQINGRPSSHINNQTGPGYSCPAMTISQVGTLNPNIPEAPWVPAVVITGLGVAAALGHRRLRGSRTARTSDV